MLCGLHNYTARFKECKFKK